MDGIPPGIGSLQLTETDIMSQAVDLFKKMEKEISFLDGRQVVIRPEAGLNSDGPLIFTISSQGSQYIQLSSTRLHLKLKIVKTDGTDCEDDESVAYTNLPISSLFSSVSTEIDGNLITDLSATNYPYLNYLQHLLNYSNNSAMTHLRASGWHMDKAGEYDTNTDVNLGWKGRRHHKNGLELYGPINIDLLNSDRLMPPNMSIVLKLARTDDTFGLMSEDAALAHKIVIVDAKLYTQYVIVNDDIKQRHERLILKTPALLPMNRTLIKTFAFAAGLTQTVVPHAFSGILPKHLLIGLVDQNAFNGSIKLNPFNFKHYDVNHIAIRLNGEQIPSAPYNPDFAKGHCIREFKDLYDNIGIGSMDFSCMINFDHFKNGCTLYSFDLTPDKCGGQHFHHTKRGQIDIEFRFKNNLTQAIQMVIMATFDSYVTIDVDRKVTCIY